jgi:type IV pilus assembly protein PilO
MKMSELQNLDPAKIGSWPTPIKAVVIVVLCAAVLGGGFYFVTEPQMVDLDKSERAEVELRRTLEAKQRKAANLVPLQRQLAEIQRQFGGMLRLLPNKTEIEGLLIDISKSGLASGLEFELFRPEAEKPAEFYAIKPIRIKVIGSYHEFGEYISAVAALPRIVTQHEITIKPRDGQTRSNAGEFENPLVMELTARTYRYLDERDGEDGEGG